MLQNDIYLQRKIFIAHYYGRNHIEHYVQHKTNTALKIQEVYTQKWFFF